MTARPTRLTARRLNRATLGRQLLLERASVGVVDAVARVVTLQAQEPASPYLALWNRVAGFDPADLDRAFAERRLVKATLMRLTMHVVTAADYPAVHEAMQRTQRGARLYDPRFLQAGLSIEETDALIAPLRELLSRPRSREAIETWLDERLGPPPRARAWWALRHYGPFLHAPTDGPWSFGSRAYLAAPLGDAPIDEPTAMRSLIRRYLQAFGPASPRDVRQFGMLLAAPVKAAVGSLLERGDVVRLEGPDGKELIDVPDGPLPEEDSPAPPRLLGMWDEILLAYADRGRVIPEEHRGHVTRVNGDVLPTLLVDGRVVGVWRARDGVIEASAFERLADDDWEALAREARSLLGLLAARDGRPYGRRYDHWWARLPSGEVRLLGT